MDITLFSDLVEALGKVVSALNSLVGIPEKERDKYRQTFHETYRLLDTALNMVIIYLGEIRLIDDPNKFKLEVSHLGNFNQWLQIERDFRLCYNLRVAYSETRSLRSKLVRSHSVNDWDALLKQMESVFYTETEVAGQISKMFSKLAETSKFQPLDTVRQQVDTIRDALIEERQQLINNEIELFKKI